MAWSFITGSGVEEQRAGRWYFRVAFRESISGVERSEEFKSLTPFDAPARAAARTVMLDRLNNPPPLPTTKREVLRECRRILADSARTRAERADDLVAYLATVVGED